MARARKYPPANTTAQWFEELYSRTTMNPVSKLLLHTTETAGWPGYDGGASAPTTTYNPWVPAGQRWRQHNYLDRSARALRDPAGTAVRENQDGVVQVEIICYCDPNLYKKYGKGVNALPDHAYEDLGAFLAFLHTEHAVPLVRAPQWSTFPPPDSIRMTGPEYDQFRGVLGHQHASGNTHGDPGMTNAQVDRILAVAKRLTTPAPTTPAEPTPSKPTTQTGDLTVAQYDDIMNAIKVEATNNANRYSDLANRMKALTSQEALRYSDYVRRFNSILTSAATEDKLDDAAVAELRGILGEVKTAVEALPTEPDPKA